MKSRTAPNILTRRSFLGRGTVAGLGAAGLTATIRDLRLINTALAFDPPSDYKALVCLFLAGGNDSFNMVIPTDQATYDQYAAIRGNLVLPKSSLLQLNHSGTDAEDGNGRTIGLHPALTGMQTLYSEGKLAPVLNCGSLVRPITKAEYTANAAGTRPPQLFSHSNQQTQWQTSLPDQPPATGWTGRVADLINSVANPSGEISMSVSVAGANTLQIGNLISQYQVSTNGAVTLNGDLMSGDDARVRALREILDLNHPNLQRKAYADVVDLAIETGQLLNDSIQATDDTGETPAWTWGTPFPTTSLGNQLKMIARLIEAGPKPAPAGFNMKRQVFFCRIGGWDTHNAQVDANDVTAGPHADLLGTVNDGVYAFQRAMEQLGLSDKVTLFTASDFSRTFTSNGKGSDHGWGANCLIAGGAVQGGTVAGDLPEFVINGPDDTGKGRWIPELAVDQHAATLAKWYGLSDTDIDMVLPNIGRFASRDLGFMT